MRSLQSARRRQNWCLRLRPCWLRSIRQRVRTPFAAPASANRRSVPAAKRRSVWNRRCGFLVSFHFPFHQAPQGAVDSRLVAPAFPAEPREHVGIQPQRDRLLDRLVELQHVPHRNLPLRRIGRRRQAPSLAPSTLPPAARRFSALPRLFSDLRNSLSGCHRSHTIFILLYVHNRPKSFPAGALWKLTPPRSRPSPGPRPP